MECVETNDTSTQAQPARLGELIRALGPGIMMATAAVGGSHLVSSTKAGAIYGWQLAVVILLVNLFKYPFFRAGIQFTMGTGKSLIEGYSDMGKIYLWFYTILTAVSAVVNTAALLLFSSSLFSYFFPFEVSSTIIALFIALVCLFILFAGHYKALDKLSKIIMIVLATTTVLAVIIAAGKGAVAPVDFKGPSIWDMAAIGFIVPMMGWMPAPIEISTITSMWLKNQRKEEKVTSQSALFDFNVGYIGTAILAIFFLALGALVLHGNGQELASSGMGFSHQLVSMYSSNIGEWSRYLIALVAFFCIFGSTITVIDGYCRAVAEAHLLIRKKPLDQRAYHNGWMIGVTTLGMGILFFCISELMTMLNFAMILSFMTTPFFALLNYKLVSRSKLTGDLAMGPKLKALCWIGLIYLFGFLGLFIWWKWLI
jgi:Mn2+/Fe2+ NRAMP family transporter